MLFQHRPAILNRSCPSRDKQQGVVIVVALFIVAIVATMAYFMMARLARDTERTSLLLHDVQAGFYAQGSIAWAVDQLHNDWENQKPNSKIDAIPIRSPQDEENGYFISSIIYDMQARFNLNSLSKTEAQQGFLQLLQVLEPKLTQQQAQDIVRAAVDWITPAASQNQYNKYYVSLPLPYRAAHRAMSSASELRLVKGVTPALFNALQPYITALPSSGLINVQTASAPVLVTLSPTMNLSIAQAILQWRAQSPNFSKQMFLNSEMAKSHRIAVDEITDVSHYFLVETNVTIEKQHAVIYTLLERVTNGNKAVINIVWTSRGIW